MGIPTLIKTLTASGDSSLSFVDGTASVTLDSTYDEYMFVFTDVNPATDNANFQFQTSIDSGSNYNVTTTNTFFRATLYENNTNASLAYIADEDVAQGTGMINFAGGIGSGADESASGILHLFSPASTTYVKHFYSRCNFYKQVDATYSDFVAGYANTTSAVDAIKFNMSSGNFDGVVQMYGIS